MRKILKKNETSELVGEKLNENLYRIWKNLMKPIFWRKNECKLHYVREKNLIKTLESKNAGKIVWKPELKLRIKSNVKILLDSLYIFDEW